MRKLAEIGDESWQELLVIPYHEIRTIIALSVDFSYSDDAIILAQEHNSEHLSEHPQFAEYYRRIPLLELAISEKWVPSLQPKAVIVVDDIAWVESSERIALVPFVSWAIHEKWKLPQPLLDIRNQIDRTALENKYKQIIPKLRSIFSNAGRFTKKASGYNGSLRDVAMIEEPENRKRPVWDEYSFLVWLRHRGHI